MKEYGYLRVAGAVPNLKVADVEYNKNEIIKILNKAEDKKIDVLVFPELALTGYTSGDLFFQNILRKRTIESLVEIKEKSVGKEILFFVGAPLTKNGSLYNTAVALKNGEILGVVPKSFIPNYNEFYEKRWFSSGKNIKNSEMDKSVHISNNQ